MKHIILTQGYISIMDDEDFDRVAAFRWHAVKIGNAVYGARHDRDLKRRVYLHRFIMNAPKGREVDHINRNGLDNRRQANLRLCSHAENLRNQKVSAANKSGYRGVGWHKKTEKYRAYIKHSGKFIHLGLFRSAELAAIAYDDAAAKLHGKFAHLNCMVV